MLRTSCVSRTRTTATSSCRACRTRGPPPRRTRARPVRLPCRLRRCRCRRSALRSPPPAYSPPARPARRFPIARASDRSSPAWAKKPGVAVPATDLIVCSTAPLAAPLAADIERRCATRLLEVYGSTETGQIALRRPTEGPEWRLWPGIKLSARGEETWAQGGHIEQPTRLWDVLEVTGAGRFLLHGRVADLVNIAGKRSSLAYLDHQLNSIP